MERKVMIMDAWEGFLARPAVGFGSWQHARNYINSYITEAVGVHSIVLQFAYEYGIYGLLFGGYLLLRSGQGLVVAVYGDLPAAGSMLRSDQPLMVLLGVGMIYNLVASPFANIYRIYFGITLGLYLYLIELNQAAPGRAPSRVAGALAPAVSAG